MANWHCKDCGCESAETSDNCEICDAPRATSGVATRAEVPPPLHRTGTFELDGEQIAYSPEPANTKNPLGSVNAHIARIKKNAGL